MVERPQKWFCSSPKMLLIGEKHMINSLYTAWEQPEYSISALQYLLETCTQDWPGKLFWRLNPQTTALWSRKMWKQGEISEKSWWNEVRAAGQGIGNGREFVSSWERFSSSPGDELGFGKEQCLPFHQCLCPFPAGPKLFTGNFQIRISFGWSAHLNPCHETCGFQRGCSHNFRAKGKVRDLPGFPTGRALKSFLPWQRGELGNHQQLWHTPNSVRNGAPHPKPLPGTETQAAFLGMREGRKKSRKNSLIRFISKVGREKEWEKDSLKNWGCI